MEINDLQPDPENPREITPRAKGALGVSLDEFGDLSGITWNKKTGHLVTGHQRLQALKDKYGEENLIIDEGDIITPEGRFKLRVVEWSLEKQRMANLVANSPEIQGSFTPGALDIIADVGADNPDLAGDLLLNDLADSLTFDSPGGPDLEGGGAGGSETEVVFDQTIQLKPKREYVIILCDEDNGNWERLKTALDLQTTRRGGYKPGSPWDEIGIQRVINADDLLDLLEGVETDADSRSEQG